MDVCFEASYYVYDLAQRETNLYWREGDRRGDGKEDKCEIFAKVYKGAEVDLGEIIGGMGSQNT